MVTLWVAGVLLREYITLYWYIVDSPPIIGESRPFDVGADALGRHKERVGIGNLIENEWRL